MVSFRYADEALQGKSSEIRSSEGVLTNAEMFRFCMIRYAGSKRVEYCATRSGGDSCNAVWPLQ